MAKPTGKKNVADDLERSLKAAMPATEAVEQRPNMVVLADGIDSDAQDVLALSRMLHVIGEVMMSYHDDTHKPAEVFEGVAVVANVIGDKVDAINERATELYKAYVGDAR